jgi:hypothetical protein
MMNGAAALPAQAPAASRAEAACPVTIYNETLKLHSFERLGAMGARR